MKRYNTIKVLLLFFVVIYAIGCGGKDNAKNAKAPGSRPLNAKAIVVAEQEINNQYIASGTIIPNEEVLLYPETSGRITGLYFKEGNNVKKGALLVQLYDAEIKAQIQKLKVQRDLAIQSKNRQGELLSINGISQQEYDNTIAQIASLDADIAFNNAQLSKLQIKAPFDGIIGLRNVSEGAIVNTNTLISNIRQVSTLKLDFSLPEQYGNVIQNGQQVEFVLPNAQDTFKAKVMAIQSASDIKTRTLDIRATILDKNPLFIPGSFVKVMVNLNYRPKGIIIPSQCIMPSTKDSKVARLKNGVAEIISVKTGLRKEETVEIISGLNIGDTVLTTAIMQVKQGMPVVAQIE